MARLTAAQRRRMPASEYAEPSKRAYPINDRNHAEMALAMVSKYGSEHEKAVVRAAVRRHFPNMKIGTKG